MPWTFRLRTVRHRGLSGVGCPTDRADFHYWQLARLRHRHIQLALVVKNAEALQDAADGLWRTALSGALAHLQHEVPAARLGPRRALPSP